MRCSVIKLQLAYAVNGDLMHRALEFVEDAYGAAEGRRIETIDKMDQYGDRSFI